ncbi:MAG: ester cyclase [Promethearchaeota archaeon]
MSLEENKAIVRRFIEAYNERNLDLCMGFIASDYVDHTNKVDRDDLKQLLILAFKGFPDLHESIEDIIAEGDKVWIRVKTTGTHTGEWRGLAPTGIEITSNGVDIYRIVNGKIAEYRNVSDQLSFLKQLGLIEYTEKGKQLSE